MSNQFASQPVVRLHTPAPVKTRDDGTETRLDAIRGLIVAEPEAAERPQSVLVLMLNEQVAADRSHKDATLAFRIEGNADRGRAFYDAIIDAYHNFPKDLSAILFGWWHAPVQEYAAAALEGPEFDAVYDRLPELGGFEGEAA